jgi:hypothetical protein
MFRISASSAGATPIHFHIGDLPRNEVLIWVWRVHTGCSKP